MHKLLFAIIISILILNFPAFADGTLSKDLEAALMNSDSDARFDVIISLKQQFSVQKLVKTLGKNRKERKKLRKEIIANLKKQSQENQHSLRQLCENLSGKGRLRKLQSFWLVNGISLNTDRAGLRELLARPEVKDIFLDKKQRWIEPEIVLKNAVTRTKDVSSLAGEKVPGFEDLNTYGKEIVQAPEVHSQFSLTGQGITIAVLDTGVEENHQEFLRPDGTSRVRVGQSFVPGEPGSGVDENGHGTHCASTAAGNVHGVAPDAEILAIKVLGAEGGGSFTGIIDGISFAVSEGADVLSMSLGTDGDTPGEDMVEQSVRQAIEQGSVFCIAAGNAGPDKRTVGSPGTTPLAITVGAMNQLGELASFSSRGPNSEGVAKPEVCGPGVNIRAAAPNNSFASLSGTSMATPHIAGVVALLLEANPELSPGQIKTVLIETTVGDSSKNQTGSGLVNALNAVHFLEQNPNPSPDPGEQPDFPTKEKALRALVKKTAQNAIAKILAEQRRQVSFAIQDVFVDVDTLEAIFRAKFRTKQKPKVSQLLTLEMVASKGEFILKEDSVQAILAFVNAAILGEKIDTTDGLAIAPIDSTNDYDEIFSAEAKRQRRSLKSQPQKEVIFSVRAIENDILNLVNKERKSRGLTPVKLNSILNKSAVQHAKDMANKNYFSHTSKDGRSPFDRMRDAGYTNARSMGENIAAGQTTAQQVMNTWMNSSGHRANILSTNFTELGVGFAQNNNSKFKFYWVQNFGRR